MTAASWSLTTTLPSDTILSPDGTRLYAAGDDGNIRVYNTATGSLLATWDVGADLGAIDISPNGSFLAVVEQQPVSGNPGAATTIAVYKVNTSTGAVQSFPTSSPNGYPFYDIAVLSNGNILITSDVYSDNLPIWTLNPATGAYSGSPNSYYARGSLTRSEDGAQVTLTTNISDAPIYVYQVGSGIIHTHRSYEDGVMGYNPGVEAFNLSANLIAQAVYGDGIVVYDKNLNFEFKLEFFDHPDLQNSVAGLAFDQSGENLYALCGGTDTVVQISTSDWSVVRSYDVGADVVDLPWNAFGNRLLLGPDGTFIVTTTSGVRVVTQDAVIDEFLGTSGSDVLVGDANDNAIDGLGGNNWIYGEGGNDNIAGGSGDDFLNGGPGSDIMNGGAGGDTYYVDDPGDQIIEAEGGGGDTVFTMLGAGSTLQQRIANAYVMPDNVEYLHSWIRDIPSSPAGQGIRGNTLSNYINTGGGSDFVDAADGGSDQIYTEDGRDVIYYGGALDASDITQGGDQGGDIRGDLLIIQGDYSAGLTLGASNLIDIEKLRVLKGSNTSFGDAGTNLYDYNITTVDANVGARARLVVQGGSLQAGEQLIFNGAAETDGSFQVFGGHDSDTISGGAQADHLLGRSGDDTLNGNDGNDRLRGGLGGDTMDGGAGADTFIYAAQGGDEPYSVAALESTSLGYDTIIGFNYAQDKIDLPNAVSSLASVNAGTLSDGSFDADLASAVDASLAANGAVLFTANSGGHSGETFLVVDADGNGSYQANLDFVIQLQAPLDTGFASVAMFV